MNKQNYLWAALLLLLAPGFAQAEGLGALLGGIAKELTKGVRQPTNEELATPIKAEELSCDGLWDPVGQVVELDFYPKEIDVKGLVSRKRVESSICPDARRGNQQCVTVSDAYELRPSELLDSRARYEIVIDNLPAKEVLAFYGNIATREVRPSTQPKLRFTSRIKLVNSSVDSMTNRTECRLIVAEFMGFDQATTAMMEQERLDALQRVAAAAKLEEAKEQSAKAAKVAEERDIAKLIGKHLATVRVPRNLLAGKMAVKSRMGYVEAGGVRLIQYIALIQGSKRLKASYDMKADDLIMTVRYEDRVIGEMHKIQYLFNGVDEKDEDGRKARWAYLSRMVMDGDEVSVDELSSVMQAVAMGAKN